MLERHARLSGWVHTGGVSSHWSQPLAPGDVLTCTGHGFGDGTGFTPGFGIEWTSEASIAAGAVHGQLSPDQGAPWAHHPRDGVLRPLDD